MEVLLAFVIATVAVAASQRLMFRLTASSMIVVQHATALQAASRSQARINAFHRDGLWPSGVLAPGQWFAALGLSINDDSTHLDSGQCINRWCSVDQWSGFEATALACELSAKIDLAACESVLMWPGESISPKPFRSRLVGFEATISVEDSLVTAVRWPKSIGQSTIFAGTDALFEASDWHEVVLGERSTERYESDDNLKIEQL